MNVAFLFPGQGARIADLAIEWQRGSARVAARLDETAHLLGTTVDSLLARRGHRLGRVDALEPVQTALTIGIYEEIAARGVFPDIVAGHSLGELAACVAAGCLRASDAIALALVRGRVMHREAERHPGGMLAITTTEPRVAEDVAAAAAEHGMAAIAAHNTPDQWVIAGEWSALRAVAGRCGGMPLEVAGPWHTPAMAGAVAEYFDALCATQISAFRVPFVSNRTGCVVANASEIPRVLAEQLTHQVLWVEVMSAISAAGASAAVLIAPTRIVASLVHHNAGSHLRTHAIEAPADLDKLAEAIAR